MSMMAKYAQMIKDLNEVVWNGGIWDGGIIKGLMPVAAIARLNVIWPEERNSKSKVYLLFDGTTNKLQTYKAYNDASLLAYGALTKRQNVWFNDVLIYNGISHYSKYSTRMRFKSTKWGVTIDMMAKELNVDLVNKLTRGVLIGRFTFTRVGGSLALIMATES